MTYNKQETKYRAHPWHGVEIGNNTPSMITCYIEMVPSDAVKYEIDKETGYLRVDRPQKYSSVVPGIYGFIPKTYSDKNVAYLTCKKTGRCDIKGDGDPLDICVLTETNILHGDILVQAKPIGGFRMLDDNEADDKIIAVLKDDAVYGNYNDITELPPLITDRLKHYFLTYKDMPQTKSAREITHVYNIEEAHEVIMQGIKDYQECYLTENTAVLV